jgi:palmitoyltransferase ZDHHC9/14/18
MTEQETIERFTANTSPTQGHRAPGSLSDSVRPLQQTTGNKKGLSLDVGGNYSGNKLATPSKSPRSFRSSFLLPTRGDNSGLGSNRNNTLGREKLVSRTSSPGLTPIDNSLKQLKLANPGSNYEYFTGNTVFCWGGRLQNTRDKPINIATGFLVVTPSVLYFVFTAPWLWHNISPAIPIIFGYLFYLCISSFIHASVSDPGVSCQF